MNLPKPCRIRPDDNSIVRNPCSLADDVGGIEILVDNDLIADWDEVGVTLMTAAGLDDNFVGSFGCSVVDDLRRSMCTLSVVRTGGGDSSGFGTFVIAFELLETACNEIKIDFDNSPGDELISATKFFGNSHEIQNMRVSRNSIYLIDFIVRIESNPIRFIGRC